MGLEDQSKLNALQKKPLPMLQGRSLPALLRRDGEVVSTVLKLVFK